MTFPAHGRTLMRLGSADMRIDGDDEACEAAIEVEGSGGSASMMVDFSPTPMDAEPPANEAEHPLRAEPGGELRSSAHAKQTKLGKTLLSRKLLFYSTTGSPMGLPDTCKEANLNCGRTDNSKMKTTQCNPFVCQ